MKKFIYFVAITFIFSGLSAAQELSTSQSIHGQEGKILSSRKLLDIYEKRFPGARALLDHSLERDELASILSISGVFDILISEELSRWILACIDGDYKEMKKIDWFFCASRKLSSSQSMSMLAIIMLTLKRLIQAGEITKITQLRRITFFNSLTACQKSLFYAAVPRLHIPMRIYIRNIKEENNLIKRSTHVNFLASFSLRGRLQLMLLEEQLERALKLDESGHSRQEITASFLISILLAKAQQLKDAFETPSREVIFFFSRTIKNNFFDGIIEVLRQMQQFPPDRLPRCAQNVNEIASSLAQLKRPLLLLFLATANTILSNKRRELIFTIVETVGRVILLPQSTELVGKKIIRIFQLISP